MSTYTFNIDRLGNLFVTLIGITPNEFCRFAHKASSAKIPLIMTMSFGSRKTMQSNFQYKMAIENILTELSINAHDTTVFDVPQSVRNNEDTMIKVVSFDKFGDLTIKTQDRRTNTDKFSAIFYSIVKRIFQNKVAPVGDTTYVISSVTKNLMRQFVEALAASRFETSPLTPVLNGSPEDKEGYVNPMVLAEISDNPNWLLKITVNQGSRDPSVVSKQMDDVITFLFPKKADTANNIDTQYKVAQINTSMRTIYYLRCDFRELKNLQKMLEKNDFNTAAMGALIDELIRSKKIKKTRVDGQLDGFKTNKEFTDLISQYENMFFRNLNIPEEDKKFFPAQVKGIQFLYSRQSALLGDEVGVGKTIQCIVAADIRMKTSGPGCLIITKNAVVPQLVVEIQKITGASDADISENWQAPSRWTVLPYQLFEEDSLFSSPDGSKKPLREIVTETLINYAKQKKFTVCILDEIHMVKNGNPEDKNLNGFLKHRNSHRKFNVQEVTKYIPFVWGASATIVANKPRDLLNQLQAVNHGLGNMEYGEFKRRFESSDDEEEKMQKADMIRDLLTDQGIYIRRSKKEVNPNIPEMTVNESPISLSSDEIDEIMQGVRNRERPSAQEMSKIREKIAMSKVPNTVAYAISIMERGNKVGIFTAHADSLKEIQRLLKLDLDAMYPGQNKQVAAIYGGQNRTERQNLINEFKNPTSQYMAIVISIDAGGTGLDFPNILTDVIVNDFDWSPSDDDQSLGRFYRISSRKSINVTYMIADNTLDRKFYNLLQEKKKIAEKIQTLSEAEKKAAESTSTDAKEQLARIRKEKWDAIKHLSGIRNLSRGTSPDAFAEI
jgi:SNF2 family DNA or RNA helicase